MAISAVDMAFWDLKARLAGSTLAGLLGARRHNAMVYGSGGFTSYSIKELQEQLAAWAGAGIKAVKMKVGAEPAQDITRVRAAREAIGADVDLFVDANGAYDRPQAACFAEAFHRQSNVRWFEEPVTSDDLEGLRWLRDRAPAGLEIAAGEYGYDAVYFRRMLQAGAIDVLQADATRCGVTGFLEAAALCDAWTLPLSAHCAPSIHAQLACAAPRVRHIEYFHDHVRIESLLFDGFAPATDGSIAIDPAGRGIGLSLKTKEAERYAIYGH
jgi:L-alanine-DL-glutamate epimerase-like enolase superfamily enzyme